MAMSSIALQGSMAGARGKYVLYVMQSSQRTIYNSALDHAISLANNLSLPLLVIFRIVDSYMGAGYRQYKFMLEGLNDVANALNRRNIAFVVLSPSNSTILEEIIEDSAFVVTDVGYLKTEREWRHYLRSLSPKFIEVESNVIVPVGEASQKEEYGAFTIRRKLMEKLGNYLIEPKNIEYVHSMFEYEIDSFDVSEPERALKRLSIDRDTRYINTYEGGEAAASARLKDFIINHLDGYSKLHSDPSKDFVSHLSPYLHFGQISPLHIALSVLTCVGDSTDAFIEELFVRRELSVNFVTYNENYDSIQCLPGWALDTLHLHSSDSRDYEYDFKTFENAQTHDPYWNAAQNELVKTGFMHGYMRMYWGKKIIEWTESPEKAYDVALRLNNTYELDGRDPNGYAGIAWCFGKHDRAWKEREIFGKVRYMNAKGLERKFDIGAYVTRIESL